MHRRRLPSLIAVRAFEAFSRSGSIRSAGDELAVSHTVISRHIQNLEDTVSTRLVKRFGRGLQLTREGERFAAKAKRALDLIADACSELSHGSGDALHVCCMAGLASYKLLARLPDLEAALNGRELILQPTASRPDFEKDEADAEIIYLEDPVQEEGLRSELFARPRILAVASPILVSRFPNVSEPQGIVDMPLLHERSSDQWENWLLAIGVTDIPHLTGPRLWHGHFTMEAAKLGQGVALVSDLVANDAIARGELVEVIPGVSTQLGGYYFVAPERMWNDPAVATVRRWLISTLR
ncbi:DNA-binding transcriptional regulator, LysR family [Paraburkholderia fungorum]|uniref:DNA-binding transcriptional regulator, LysR family n=1 Tax=Paraburkholderia fungorum TaxID=134537 RepID=A0A1H1JVI8_9BURK|nr:LysR substrate-binding domain-containing protein [Paraburkholderia fungorum]SDR53852.1 DNA-binding transcriptional regulator, LysR family [Paraburkholderia fungorum]